MNIGIVPNLDKKDALNVLRRLINMKYDCFNYTVTNKVKKYLVNESLNFGNINKSDMIITLGGDGTLIGAAREYSSKSIPILGVNLGHLGYLAEINNDGLEDALKNIRDNNYSIEERMMLEAKIIKDGNIVEKHIAINDVLINSKSSRMVDVVVSVDNKFLDNYRADALMVSTPTGSTAYNLSAGGPILEPLMACMLITPVSPHSLHSRPMGVCDKRTISLQPDTNYNPKTIVSIDGQKNICIKENMKVNVAKATSTMKLVKFNEIDFYDILKKKLSER